LDNNSEHKISDNFDEVPENVHINDDTNTLLEMLKNDPALRMVAKINGELTPQGKKDLKKLTHGGEYVELPCENAEKCSDGCLGFRITKTLVSSSSVEDIVCVPTETCATCESYFEFCEPAESNDENGCSGRTLITGELYPRCLACIGIDAGDPENK